MFVLGFILITYIAIVLLIIFPVFRINLLLRIIAMPYVCVPIKTDLYSSGGNGTITPFRDNSAIHIPWTAVVIIIYCHYLDVLVVPVHDLT